jgi:hypothetical protein
MQITVPSSRACEKLPETAGVEPGRGKGESAARARGWASRGCGGLRGETGKGSEASGVGAQVVGLPGRELVPSRLRVKCFFGRLRRALWASPGARAGRSQGLPPQCALWTPPVSKRRAMTTTHPVSSGGWSPAPSIFPGARGARLRIWQNGRVQAGQGARAKCMRSSHLSAHRRFFWALRRYAQGDVPELFQGEHREPLMHPGDIGHFIRRWRPSIWGENRAAVYQTF